MSRTEDVNHGLCKKFKTFHANDDRTSCEKNQNEGENDRTNDVSNLRLSDDVREAGPYFLGPVVKRFVRTPATQCLARKKGTDEYYLMKILILNDDNLRDKFHLQRRTIFHTEYSILTLLKKHPGVVQLHDFFKDEVYEETKGEPNSEKTKLKRMCMVLECLIPHGHHNPELIPLTHYIKEKKKLSEAEALIIFYNLLKIVESLHEMNIVHKDLKLSNIILNRKTLEVKLINFYYAKLLSSDKEISYDQRGSLSYSSPDKITGHPVPPKPCEMWSAGVILYTILHGHLPFASSSGPVSTRSLADLNYKIINADYAISNELSISHGTKKLIRRLLWRHSNSRLKANEAVDRVLTLLALQSSALNPVLLDENKCADQIVPECQDFESKDEDSPEDVSECWLVVNSSSSSDDSISSKTYKIELSELEPRSTSPDAKRIKLSEEPLDGEKDIFSRSCKTKPNLPQRRNSFSKTSKIKFAMLKLGATSVSNINALSFNYGNKSPFRVDENS